MRGVLTLAAALSLLAAGVQAHEVKAGDLTLSDLAVRASLGNVPTSAAYLTIANAGKTPDKLLSVDCACAAMAMMHRTQTAKGVTDMAMVDQVVIPAGGKAVFSPDGLHIMLTGLKAPLKAGAMQTLTLTFEKAGKVKAGFHVGDVIPKR